MSLLASAAQQVDWTSILGVVIGVVITVLVGLIAYIFKTYTSDTGKRLDGLNEGLKEGLKDVNEGLKEVDKHAAGLATSYIQLLWRQDYIDEFLARRFEEYIGKYGGMHEPPEHPNRRKTDHFRD